MCQKISINGSAYNVKDMTAHENIQSAAKNASDALADSAIGRLICRK